MARDDRDQEATAADEHEDRAAGRGGGGRTLAGAVAVGRHDPPLEVVRPRIVAGEQDGERKKRRERTERPRGGNEDGRECHDPDQCPCALRTASAGHLRRPI